VICGKINYILYKYDRVPIRTASKILACCAFCLINLACGAFCFIKNLACGAFFSYCFCLNRVSFDLKFLVLSTDSLVVKMIPTPILSDHNDLICTNQ